MWKMTKRVMRFPTPSPSFITPVCDKANALAESLDAHIQPITDLWVPAVAEKVDEADCFTLLANKRKTSPTKFKISFGVSMSVEHHTQKVCD